MKFQLEETTTETMLQSEGMETKKPHCDILSEKEFIGSPAEIDTHRKVKLQDAKVLNINENNIKKPCCRVRAWKMINLTVTYHQRRSS